MTSLIQGEPRLRLQGKCLPPDEQNTGQYSGIIRIQFARELIKPKLDLIFWASFVLSSLLPISKFFLSTIGIAAYRFEFFQKQSLPCILLQENPTSGFEWEQSFKINQSDSAPGTKSESAPPSVTIHRHRWGAFHPLFQKTQCKHGNLIRRVYYGIIFY